MLKDRVDYLARVVQSMDHATVGGVTELRVLCRRKGRIISGYFDGPLLLAQAAVEYDGQENIYITLNPVKPDLMARAYNRVEDWAKLTTSDGDALCDLWLLVDADPKRPSGICSTDDEVDAAIEVSEKVAEFMFNEFGAKTVWGLSGNGGHGLTRLPGYKPTPVVVATKARLLKFISSKFSTDAVEVDTTVGNLSRITRLYGTVNVKGDDIPSRPHRRSHLDISGMPPEPIDIYASVDRVCIERTTFDLGASTDEKNDQSDEPVQKNGGKNRRQEFDLEGLLKKTGLTYRVKKEAHCTLFHFQHCPLHTDDDGHTFECCVLQHADGKLGASCKHDDDLHWQDFKPALIRLAQPRTMEAGKSGERAELRLTDLMNARLLVERHGHDLRSVPGWGWLFWDGTRWRRDDVGEVDRRAKQTIDELRARADAVGGKAVNQALKCESNARIRGMVALAASELSVIARPEDFDADPYVLNLTNGTLDLSTGRLWPHGRQDLISKVAGVRFDPDATCPTWTAFLDKIMAGKTELISSLQRAVGYSLTGVVDEQVLEYLWGEGANGKSTFLRTVQSMLGDYARQAEPDLLVAKRGEVHPTGVADLVGARLVISTEVESGKAMAEVLVKQLTGGDKVKARFMRQDFFEFEPTHKLWLCGNHKLMVRGTDAAIWRRIRLVPFTVTIPEEEQDKTLPTQLLAELPGILNWAVQGCLAWQQEGLAPSSDVIEATAAYREEMDVLGAFLAECCQIHPEEKTTAAALYAAFRDWCDANGEYLVSQRVFGGRLATRGLQPAKGSGGTRMWQGVALKEAKVAEVAHRRDGSYRRPNTEETKKRLSESQRTSATMRHLRLM